LTGCSSFCEQPSRLKVGASPPTTLPVEATGSGLVATASSGKRPPRPSVARGAVHVWRPLRRDCRCGRSVLGRPAHWPLAFNHHRWCSFVALHGVHRECLPELDTKRRRLLICIEAHLQAATTPTTFEDGRLLDVPCGQHAGLLVVDGGQGRHGCSAVDADAVALDAAQLRQRRIGTEFVLGLLESMPHHPVQDQAPESTTSRGRECAAAVGGTPARCRSRTSAPGSRAHCLPTPCSG